MKIKEIKVVNFKSIVDKQLDLSGCSAVITGGNNKGKSSILSGLIDRMRGEKPDIIVREGSDKGSNTMVLTDDSKIEWRFTEKSESLSYTTKDGIKQTSGVIKTIGERYFGKKFDIDNFLNSTPKEQTKELQRIVGLDFSDINERYKITYEERTAANKELQRVISLDKKEPEKVEKPDIESLEKEKKSIIEKNNQTKEDWKKKNQEQREKILNFNAEQGEKASKYEITEGSYQLLLKHKTGLWSECIDFDKAKRILDSTPKPIYENNELLIKEVKDIQEPEYKPLDAIEQKIKEAWGLIRLFDSYEKDLTTYKEWVEEGKQARKKANESDDKIKAIEQEKKDLIASAKMPSEFKITDDGILYNGLPLSNAQTSSSSKYIAALKLGLMVIGEIRSMYFDASYLDKNSLNDVYEWAKENDLQLLIERPDYEGGEIKYNIISE